MQSWNAKAQHQKEQRCVNGKGAGKKGEKKRNAAARACGRCAITFFFSVLYES